MPNTDPIQTAAKSIAADMIDAARNSGAEPVAFVTGNSYMPPIRSYPEAEAIWQAADDSDAIGLLMETVEELLAAASVALESPEYDNCLYVVDLARFEYREDADDSDTFSGPWQAI